VQHPRLRRPGREREQPGGEGEQPSGEESPRGSPV
jgi:hypothetical protein